MLAIISMTFGFLAHKDLNYLPFKYFGFERTDEGDLRWYHTLQGDNSLKSVERFDHLIFVCRFQASR